LKGFACNIFQSFQATEFSKSWLFLETARLYQVLCLE